MDFVLFVLVVAAVSLASAVVTLWRVHRHLEKSTTEIEAYIDLIRRANAEHTSKTDLASLEYIARLNAANSPYRSRVDQTKN